MSRIGEFLRCGAVRFRSEKPTFGGQPRGGGQQGQPEVVILTRYEPAPVTHEDVCHTLGVADDGIRTPYTDLHAAVRPIRYRRIVRKDMWGRVTQTEDIPIDSDTP